MGVNRVGFCIYDDEAVKEAAVQEIIRRFMIAKCDYKKGKISEEALERSELLMKEVNASEEDRKVVIPAREYAEYKRSLDKKYVNMVAMAIEMRTVPSSPDAVPGGWPPPGLPSSTR